MKQARKRKEKVYSDWILSEVSQRIPKAVTDKLKEHGWNCFGIYETVKELLNEERLAKQKTTTSSRRG